MLFYMLSAKILILTVFTWLKKIQDGDHVWWRHRPPSAPPTIKYSSFWREDQRLSTEGKIKSFRNTATYHNSREGFHQPPRFTPANRCPGEFLFFFFNLFSCSHWHYEEEGTGKGSDTVDLMEIERILRLSEPNECTRVDGKSTNGVRNQRPTEWGRG